MLVNFAYVERDNFFQRLDPRARIIFMLCATVAVGFIPGRGTGVGIWDLRLTAVFLVIAFVQIFVAQLSWRQMRRFWLVITFIAIILSLVTLLSGRGAAGVYERETEHVLWVASLGDVTFRLSVERLSYLIAQIMRIMTFAALSVVIPFTINPSLYGITFRGLGMSDKLAYAMDLAFRFIPSLGRDFQITMDAQRARGFELDAGEGVSFLQRIRNFAPLMIPITIGSVIGGEEITDAMDLRAFGVGPRSWLPKLTYRTVDFAMIVFGILLLAGTIVLKQAGMGGLWLPEFLLALAS